MVRLLVVMSYQIFCTFLLRIIDDDDNNKKRETESEEMCDAAR